MRKISGFGLIELITVVAIVGILAAISVPSMIEWFDGFRLRRAAHAIFADLQSARAEVLKEQTKSGSNLNYLFVNFNDDADWCYGINRGAAPCDCKVTDSADTTYCSIKRVTSSDLNGVTLKDITFKTYNRNDSTEHEKTLTYSLMVAQRVVVENGSLTLESPKGLTATITVNIIGGTRMCSTNTKSGLKSC